MDHPLKRYLRASGLKVWKLAKDAGTTPSYLSQIMGGHRYPSRELARELERVTGGQVTAGELLLWNEHDDPTLDLKTVAS